MSYPSESWDTLHIVQWLMHIDTITWVPNEIFYVQGSGVWNFAQTIPNYKFMVSGCHTWYEIIFLVMMIFEI